MKTKNFCEEHIVIFKPSRNLWEDCYEAEALVVICSKQNSCQRRPTKTINMSQKKFFLFLKFLEADYPF